jgi:carbonic anhydrase/acetyltransferase-like protein (isoleucine patch superfamily)
VIDYPVTSTVVVAVSHWVHVLWLNQIAFGIRWMELIRRRPLWALARAASALSLSRHRLLGRLVWVGRGADVHPSARLSGSIVHAGAKIGAEATIKNSIVGREARVADHAVVLGSVLGDGAHVAEDTTLVSCVAYPEAWISNLKLQVSLLGRGSYVNAWAGFIDARFTGPVKVRHEGALHSTERSFIGSVVGHGARVAAKVLIQPGREIPNEAVVVMRPDEVVSSVPERLPPGVPHVRHRGTLVPLGEESP